MGRAMEAKELYAELKKLLEPERYTDVFPRVGLLYDNTDVIERVYTAAFPCKAVFDRIFAEGKKRSLLFTHHPVGDGPEGDPEREITVEMERGMREAELSLLACHIPLDAHSYYSPSRSLARRLDAVPFEPFYPQNNGLIGVLCDTPFKTVTDVAKRLESVVGHRITRFDYGPEELNAGRIAIMSGGASSLDIYPLLKDRGIGLFVTGITAEIRPWVRERNRIARECGVSILGGTHYSTEKFALIDMLEFFRSLGLDCAFIPDGPKLRDL